MIGPRILPNVKRGCDRSAPDGWFTLFLADVYLGSHLAFLNMRKLGKRARESNLTGPVAFPFF